jgi:hypothetical protein
MAFLRDHRMKPSTDRTFKRRRNIKIISFCMLQNKSSKSPTNDRRMMPQIHEIPVIREKSICTYVLGEKKALDILFTNLSINFAVLWVHFSSIFDAMRRKRGKKRSRKLISFQISLHHLTSHKQITLSHLSSNCQSLPVLSCHFKWINNVSA